MFRFRLLPPELLTEIEKYIESEERWKPPHSLSPLLSELDLRWKGRHQVTLENQLYICKNMASRGFLVHILTYFPDFDIESYVYELMESCEDECLEIIEGLHYS